MRKESSATVFDYIVGGAQIVGGGATIVGTFFEDVATGGFGVADDPLTIGLGAAAIARGLATIGR